MAKGFIADCRHDSGAATHPSYRETYDECVDIVHKFFLGYGFEIRDGRPYDSGNAFNDNDPRGYEVFCDVKIHNGKIAEFMHCDGEGPVAYIYKNK